MISELNKFMGVIKLERKQFESERERMLHFITEMDRYNREQRELRGNVTVFGDRTFCRWNYFEKVEEN